MSANLPKSAHLKKVYSEQYEKKNILTKSEADELRMIIQHIRASGEGVFRFPDKKPKFNTWTQEDQDRRWWRNWRMTFNK